MTLKLSSSMIDGLRRIAAADWQKREPTVMAAAKVRAKDGMIIEDVERHIKELGAIWQFAYCQGLQDGILGVKWAEIQEEQERAVVQ